MALFVHLMVKMGEIFMVGGLGHAAGVYDPGSVWGWQTPAS
jgi:hypothetical protein